MPTGNKESLGGHSPELRFEEIDDDPEASAQGWRKRTHSQSSDSSYLFSEGSSVPKVTYPPYKELTPRKVKTLGWVLIVFSVLGLHSEQTGSSTTETHKTEMA